jgi:hypothetical protein
MQKLRAHMRANRFAVAIMIFAIVAMLGSGTSIVFASLSLGKTVVMGLGNTAQSMLAYGVGAFLAFLTAVSIYRKRGAFIAGTRVLAYIVCMLYGFYAYNAFKQIVALSSPSLTQPEPTFTYTVGSLIYAVAFWSLEFILAVLALLTFRIRELEPVKQSKTPKK